MLVVRKRNLTRSDLYFWNTKHTETDELVTSGVTVDQKLTWSKHISNITT